MKCCCHCCVVVVVVKLCDVAYIESHTLHILRRPGLANYEEGLCLVDASINWQIIKLGVLLHWYHMHVHCNESHFMLHL